MKDVSLRRRRARTIADVLAKGAFAHRLSKAHLECECAKQELNALPFNTRWGRFACAATRGHRRSLLRWR